MPTPETARAERFAAYVDQLAGVLGHRDRHEPLRAYVTGLCLPGERKSVEPMAARVDPRHVRQRHQWLDPTGGREIRISTDIAENTGIEGQQSTFGIERTEQPKALVARVKRGG